MVKFYVIYGSKMLIMNNHLHDPNDTAKLSLTSRLFLVQIVKPATQGQHVKASQSRGHNSDIPLEHWQLVHVTDTYPVVPSFNLKFRYCNNI